MDIDFENLFGMAGSVSGTVDSALSTFNRIKALADDGKLPTDLAVDFATLSGELSKARVDLARLEADLVRIQHAYEALDKIEQRKRNYVLSETPVGERIYRLKPDAGTGEIQHDVCPNCYENNQIRILQPRRPFLVCDTCKAKIRTEWVDVASVGRRSGPGWMAT